MQHLCHCSRVRRSTSWAALGRSMGFSCRHSVMSCATACVQCRRGWWWVGWGGGGGWLGYWVIEGVKWWWVGGGTQDSTAACTKACCSRRSDAAARAQPHACTPGPQGPSQPASQKEYDRGHGLRKPDGVEGRSPPSGHHARQHTHLWALLGDSGLPHGAARGVLACREWERRVKRGRRGGGWGRGRRRPGAAPLLHGGPTRQLWPTRHLRHHSPTHSSHSSTPKE